MFTLRPFQVSAINTLKNPHHLLCIAPTGEGKSLIYEKLTEELKLRTLIVTPLVALGRQQTQNLSKKNISSIFSGHESERRIPSRSGVWISSPESLQNPRNLRDLSEWQPNFLVVDECHCLWDWGDQFRPAFAGIPQLLQQFQIKRSLWLTATLPPTAKADLRKKIPGLVDQGVFSVPDQLHLSVQNISRSRRLSFLLNWISVQNSPGVIFTSTRQSADRLGKLVNSVTPAATYHAGLSREERQSIEEKLRVDKRLSVVGTSAFGMGMDYTHLRWVILWEAPPSLLSLCQSIGRVTRSREAKSRALILWDLDDFRSSDWMVEGSVRRKEQFNEVLQFLQKRQCRKAGLEYFFDPSQNVNFNCGNCDHCDTMRYTTRITT